MFVVMQYLISWIQFIVQILLDLPYQILDYTRRLIEEIVAWIWLFVEATLVEWIANQIPPEFFQILNNPIISNLLPLVDTIIWFYPFREVILLYSGAYSVIVVSRLTRWAIGFIPMIEG